MSHQAGGRENTRGQSQEEWAIVRNAQQNRNDEKRVLNSEKPKKHKKLKERVAQSEALGWAERRGR